MFQWTPDWLVRLVNWLTVRPQVGYLWCRIYQRLFEADTSKVKLTEFASIQELEKLLNRCVWVPDGLKQLGDMMYSPKRVQLTIDRAGDGRARIGDCDEFAAYAADRILDLIKRKMPHRGMLLKEALILQCTYRNAEGKLVGHHACAVRYLDLVSASVKWGHIGNWYQGKFRKDFDEPNQMVKDFHRGGRTLHWVLVTPDLKHTVRRGFSD